MNNEEFLYFAEKAIGDWLDIMDFIGYLDLLRGKNEYLDIPKEWKKYNKNDIL